MVGGCEGREGGDQEREAAGERRDGVPPSPVRGIHPAGEGRSVLSVLSSFVM